MKPEDIIQEFNKLILFSIRTMKKKKSGKEFSRNTDLIMQISMSVSSSRLYGFFT